MKQIGTGEALFVSRSSAWRFARPLEIIQASAARDVRACLAQAARAVRNGRCVAGFLAYEAAPGLNADLSVHLPGELPVLWLGVYNDMAPAQHVSRLAGHPFEIGTWRSSVSEQAYLAEVSRLREFIAAGDTYQVNYTFPLCAPFEGDPQAWFWSLWHSQPVDHAAFIDIDPAQIVSLSPELFFRKESQRLLTRPMKGTRARGRWDQEDRAAAEALCASDKERAENVMIVDLLRNDMGQISEIGSVRVPALFEAERYRTLWQMTSTIESRTQADVPEIMAALFPSGSVTGAPKVRTMQIIRQAELAPRGIYCGAIGWWAPDGRAEFNVAIRTATVYPHRHEATYSVGSGITWCSDPRGEYDECLQKAAILTAPAPDFELLESLLLEEGAFFLQEEHLERLQASARFFDIPFDPRTASDALRGEASRCGTGRWKVRLLVSQAGGVRTESAPAPSATPVRLALAAHPVDERDVFLFHKTTRRHAYDRAKASHPDCDDVILWNTRGEITETTTANVLLCLGGEWLTPPVQCGLLAGTMRQRLLREGRIKERVLTKADLAGAQAIALVNSVRKWIDVASLDRLGAP